MFTWIIKFRQIEGMYFLLDLVNKVKVKISRRSLKTSHLLLFSFGHGCLTSVRLSTNIMLSFMLFCNLAPKKVIFVWLIVYNIVAFQCA